VTRSTPFWIRFSICTESITPFLFIRTLVVSPVVNAVWSREKLPYYFYYYSQNFSKKSCTHLISKLLFLSESFQKRIISSIDLSEKMKTKTPHFKNPHFWNPSPSPKNVIMSLTFYEFFFGFQTQSNIFKIKF
jgi:hypothetical protein